MLLKLMSVKKEIDQSQFLEFMDKNPVRCFYSMSKDEYLSKSREEKVSLISKFCNEMKSGDNFFCFHLSGVWSGSFLFS